MKVRLTMKDLEGVRDSVLMSVERTTRGTGISDESFSAVVAGVHAELARWVASGEYVTIEFDLDLGTCTVVEVRR